MISTPQILLHLPSLVPPIVALTSFLGVMKLLDL